MKSLMNVMRGDSSSTERRAAVLRTTTTTTTTVRTAEMTIAISCSTRITRHASSSEEVALKGMTKDGSRNEHTMNIRRLKANGTSIKTIQRTGGSKEQSK